MCLIKNSIFPEQAKEDIICYKFLIKENQGEFYTPYTYYPVIFGNVINSRKNFFLSIFSKKITSRGVHAYLDKKYAIRETFTFSTYTTAVVKCIIPKGAWYYKGKYNDIAANKLIVKNVKENQIIQKEFKGLFKIIK